MADPSSVLYGVEVLYNSGILLANIGFTITAIGFVLVIRRLLSFEKEASE